MTRKAHKPTAVPLTRHSRESGNPVAFSGIRINDLLDTRFRGYDINVVL